LNQGRRILIRRPRMNASGGAAEGDGRRRRPAVNGGGARRRTRSRVPGLDLKRGEHLRAARETAKQPRAAAAAGTRWSGHTSRRRGSARHTGGGPASFYGRHGVRGHQHVTRVASLPPGADPGRLHDDEEATTARDQRRRWLGFQAAAAHRGSGG
jgi:hypothetical protein